MVKAGSMFIPEGDEFFRRQLDSSGNKFDYKSLQAALKVTPLRGVAVDVGAHIGTWSIHLGRLFREVYALEPQTENWECLKKNIDLPNVYMIKVAAGNKGGFVTLKKHGTNSGCFYAVAGDEVPVITIDSLGLTELDMLKIDVEGFEGQVIGGAINTIDTFKPTVIYENNGLGGKLYRSKYINPEPIMKHLGYKLVNRINKDEIWRPS